MNQRPPTGGGTGVRHRSRYAPDDQVKRAVRLAQEAGITPTRLKLGADGSIELDSAPVGGVGVRGGDDDAEAELAACREAIAAQAAGR